MSALWWFGLCVLALPLWWHRQRRQRVKAQPLASARFLPRAAPQQLRVWQWVDRILLLVRCLLLACVVAWLAELVLPWRGDTVLVGAGTDPAWAGQQARDAGFDGAHLLAVPTADAIGWLQEHEREWRSAARLLVLGSLPMPAVIPRFHHQVELRSKAAPLPVREHHVAGARSPAWRTLFAALGGTYVLDASPNASTELIIWDTPQAPPAAMRAPLWWVTDVTAFPELKTAPEVDGIRYADSAHGRLWAVAEPHDAASARALFEHWQKLHMAPLPYPAPAQILAASGPSSAIPAAGALRDVLALILTALFALERILTHARRT
ncbi:MAG: BatA domain-containing protein [Pseudomonadota bacterium]